MEVISTEEPNSFSTKVAFKKSNLLLYENLNSISSEKGLVLGAYEGENGDIILTPAATFYDKLVDGKLLEKLQKLALAGRTLKAGQVRLFSDLADDDYTYVAVVGLGKQNADEKFLSNHGCIALAATVGCSALYMAGIRDIKIEPMGNIKAIAEGAFSINWDTYNWENKSKWESVVTPPTISLFGTEEQEQWQIERVKVDAQYFTRLLGQTPASMLTPAKFSEDVAKALSLFCGIEVIVHDKVWAKRKKIESLLDASQGSKEPPKFLEIHYTGTVSTKPPIVLVGKGVTSATTSGIESCECRDCKLAGVIEAATVATVIKAAAELQLKVNIVGLIPLTEKISSSPTIKSDDSIITVSKKKTTFTSADAENRMILADALRYAAEFKPSIVVEIGDFIRKVTRATRSKIETAKLTTNDDTKKKQCSQFLDNEEKLNEIVATYCKFGRITRELIDGIEMISNRSE